MWLFPEAVWVLCCSSRASLAAHKDPNSSWIDSPTKKYFVSQWVTIACSLPVAGYHPRQGDGSAWTFNRVASFRGAI